VTDETASAKIEIVVAMGSAINGAQEDFRGQVFTILANVRRVLLRVNRDGSALSAPSLPLLQSLPDGSSDRPVCPLRACGVACPADGPKHADARMQQWPGAFGRQRHDVVGSISQRDELAAAGQAGHCLFE